MADHGSCQIAISCPRHTGVQAAKLDTVTEHKGSEVRTNVYLLAVSKV